MKNRNYILIILIALSTFNCKGSDFGIATPTSEKMIIPSSTWTSWTKWVSPVLPGQYPLVGDPSVIRDGLTLRMFYTCFDPEKQGPVICQSTSTDGFQWTPVTMSEPLVAGRMLYTGTGPWEDTHETSFIMKKNDGTYFLYYAGYIDKGGALKSFPAYLGLAISKDATNFTPLSQDPILKGTPNWYDSDAIFSPTIVQHQGLYYMIYSGHCWENCPLGKGVFLLGATSKDGISWKKQDKPVLQDSKMPPFFKQYAAESELVKGPDGRFYLFFTALQGDNPHLLAVGRSSNPFGPWEISPDPILIPTTGRFDEAEINAPAVLIEGDKVRMWFAGFSKNPSISIGYAEAKWPMK